MTADEMTSQIEDEAQRLAAHCDYDLEALGQAYNRLSFGSMAETWIAKERQPIVARAFQIAIERRQTGGVE